MRRTKIFSLGILFGLTIFLNACTETNSKQLPSSAQAFLDKHFKDTDISSIEQDVDRDYVVYLENGIEIDFERKGTWEEMNAKKNQFPESVLQVLPQQILNYTKVNYPNQFIRKIEKKSYGYRIRLNKPNDIELCFTKNGVYIKDDSK